MSLVPDWILRPSLNSKSYPNGWIPERIPREEAAKITSENWGIFALHGNYVRPSREYEFYHGEPARLRSRASGKHFEVPPGAVYHYNSSMGHPATSWDPFLFPNPPRSFLLNQPFPHYLSPTTPGLIETTESYAPQQNKIISSGFINSKLRRFHKYAHPAESRLGGIDMEELERQLWFDPEPRWERPYRTYADTKYCIRGRRLIDIAELMRPGW